MKERIIDINHYHYRLILCTFLLLFCSRFTLAQTITSQQTSFKDLNLSFIPYNQIDGLPTNNIYGFFQDSRKFIWIRTTNGLSRYDGIDFQNFLFSSKDSNSIAGNDIRSICEMPGNLLFIGTTNGMCIYNIRFNRFENWRITDKELKPGSGAIVSSLMIDAMKNLWINFKGELHVYDSSFRLKLKYTDTGQGKILKGIITAQNNMPVDNEGNMWLMSDNLGLARINSKTLKLKCYKNTTDSIYAKQAIRGYYLDKRHSILWYSPWGMGLYKYDLTKKTLQQFLFTNTSEYSQLLRNIINSILPYQHYLLCTTGSGLIIFNTIDESHVFLEHNASNPFSLPGRELAKMIIDRDGLMWIATSNGICKSKLGKSSFGFLCEELKENNPGSAIDINHFALYNSTWLLMATVTDGLYAYNLKTHEKKHFVIKNPKKSTENFYAKVFIDRYNKIWVSSCFGLRIYNLEKNIMEMPPDEFKGLADCICIGFYQDSHWDYWMSYECSQKLAHCIHEGNSKYRLEIFNNESGNFPFVKINCITEDAQTNILASTAWAMGFLKWDRINHSITRLPRVKTPEEYLSESISEILPDNDNTIWIASSAGHGLINYNPSNNNRNYYATENGLNSSNVYAFQKHKNGDIWLSTDKGISHFDLHTKKFSNFSQEDGLPEPIVTGEFIYDAGSNMLYTSSPHYIIYFNPDSIIQQIKQDNKSEIYLKNFQVNGNTIYHDFKEALTLPPEDNNINLEFSCINYSGGKKIIFEYQLEGLDNKWLQCGPRKSVTYAHIHPGTYIFKVRISSDGINFSDAAGIATFTITRPFYLSWWFIIIMFSTSATAVYLSHIFRQRNKEALVNMRERISRDLHDDIGSTLNSISIYSEIARLKNTEEGQRKKYLETIGSSSRNMIEQMNDIVWTVNPMNDKFENILLRMRSLVSELSEGVALRLSFDVDQNSKGISLGMNERKNFYLIFKEAVNNAIKYSKASEIKIAVKRKEHYLFLSVNDNGSGFDITRPVESDQTHGGNGLRNMKARADEIHAELNIHSIIEKGTTIELKIKI